MKVLRTPDGRFGGLPDYSFPPNYAEVDGLRVHHLDEGPREGEPVLLMHGEPSWSYLYRHMVPDLAKGGLRVLAPDLPGFGRSDKPASVDDYSYARLVGWMEGWLAEVDPDPLTLFGQDWGALIGLRLVARSPERFRRVVIANGALPTGRGRVPLAFRVWRAFARWTPVFPAGWIVQAGTQRRLSREERAAYRTPFPGEAYKAGPRALPRLVPTRPDDPGAEENRAAWRELERFEKPFLTAFSDGDPIMRGLDRAFRERVPGARGRDHTTIRGAGHFLQEDSGPELARVLLEFIDGTG